MRNDIEALRERVNTLQFLAKRITDQQAEEAIKAETVKIQRQLEAADSRHKR